MALACTLAACAGGSSRLEPRPNRVPSALASTQGMQTFGYTGYRGAEAIYGACRRHERRDCGTRRWRQREARWPGARYHPGGAGRSARSLRWRRAAEHEWRIQWGRQCRHRRLPRRSRWRQRVGRASRGKPFAGSSDRGRRRRWTRKRRIQRQRQTRCGKLRWWLTGRSRRTRRFFEWRRRRRIRRRWFGLRGAGATNVSYVSAGGATGPGQVIIAWQSSMVAPLVSKDGALHTISRTPFASTLRSLHSTCTGS